MQLECRQPDLTDVVLLQPTPIPEPPSQPLTEQVTITHFKRLYGALQQCNANKQDFIHVYYPEASSQAVPASD